MTEEPECKEVQHKPCSKSVTLDCQDITAYSSFRRRQATLFLETCLRVLTARNVDGRDNLGTELQNGTENGGRPVAVNVCSSLSAKRNAVLLSQEQLLLAGLTHWSHCLQTEFSLCLAERCNFCTVTTKH